MDFFCPKNAEKGVDEGGFADSWASSNDEDSMVDGDVDRFLLAGGECLASLVFCPSDRLGRVDRWEAWF